MTHLCLYIGFLVMCGVGGGWVLLWSGGRDGRDGRDGLRHSRWEARL